MTLYRRAVGVFAFAATLATFPQTAAAQRGARDVHVHHGVHVVLGQQTGYGGLTDVGLDEVRAAQMVSRRHRVHRDDPVDLRVTLDPPDEPASQLTGHTGDEHDLPQDQRLPSSRRLTQA